MLRAYMLGLRQAQAIMQKELDETRASLEGELASLRSAVKALHVERGRARQIERAIEVERDDGFWLQ
jgi:hypothetical protein